MTDASPEMMSIFAAALERPAGGDRAAYLVEACGADHEMRSRIDALLSAHDEAGGFLRPESEANAPPNDQPLPAERSGIMVGPYKLLEPIGEGGFGVVFMAEQTHPVRRKVALKVLKPGMDTRQVVARFEAERQALALMDHPNIAKVFDGGATPSGRPYFVMELVRGVPITDFCDQAHLPPRQRLELFIEVCLAVQHAHQKGVIHRDLKPSNVLVGAHDGRPSVKVIDFGVAKAVGQELTDKTLFTGFAQLIGTPLYMSPEQVAQSLDIDTRSDVYSLGVLLYELLTGTTPFDWGRLRAAGFDELRRIIREEEPARPSTRLSTLGAAAETVSARRGTEPRKLSAIVRGELDWIVMKALEKDRNRRYETANGFADDVQRYLADVPVLACPPSAGYRLRKFVRRNVGAVAAGSIIAFLLVAGVVGTTIGLIRAQQRAEGERQAKESAEKRLAQIEVGIAVLSSVFENLDPMAEEAENRPLRAILGDRLDQAAAALEGEAVGDPLVVARLQDRLGRTYLGLGRGARAEALFAKAAATREAYLGPDDPLTLESRHNVAVAREQDGRRHEAIRMFEEVRDARQRVLGPDHLDTLATLNDLGAAYGRAGRPHDSVQLLEQVRADLGRQLGEDDDRTLVTRGKLATAYLAVGRHADAIALAEGVWAARVKKHGEDHAKAIAAMGSLAYVYQGGYRMKEALALFQRARDRIVPMLGEYHPLTLQILRHLGHMLRAYERTAEAVPLLEQVRERELMVLGGQHPSTLVTAYHLAAAYRTAGDWTKALALYQQAAAGLERLNFEHSHAQNILSSLSVVHEELGQLEEAERVRRLVLAVVERKGGADTSERAGQLIRLASLLVQQRKPAAAEAELRRALELLERHPHVRDELYGQSLLGQALADQGQHAEAEALLKAAYRGIKNFPTEHRRQGMLPWSWAVDTAARLVRLYEETNRPAEAERWRKELATLPKVPKNPGKTMGKEPIPRSKGTAARPQAGK
jgi:serine/threonine protein kinase/tetratricopeptide (TPR) repeat protein